MHCARGRCQVMTIVECGWTGARAPSQHRARRSSITLDSRRQLMLPNAWSEPRADQGGALGRCALPTGTSSQ
jgi:hypothetical protein